MNNINLSATFVVIFPNNCQLGHGNESGHSTPKRVEALFGLTIVDIACGSRHTAVVTNKGCLYTWGDKEVCKTDR